VKIYVTNVAADRRVLHFLHERGATCSFAGDLQFNQNIFSGSLAHHRVDITRGDLQRLRFIVAAVDDRGNQSARY
jgi:hypothetical protein